MQLTREETGKSLDTFLKAIEDKSELWRLISIEFKEDFTLKSPLFENICLKSLESCFGETECRIFWFKPNFILVFFQGRALPIEKCVEEFFKATEFKGLGRFFDILDLSIHWSDMLLLLERIQKALEKPEPLKEPSPSVDPPLPQAGFTIELSAEKIKHMKPVRDARKKPLILLVEGDPFTLQLIKLALKDDYDLIGAETARQALVYYQRHLPDMAFLDIQLPDGNGIHILKQISDVDDGAYAVMLSSHSQKEKIMECQSLGAKGFIGKPFTRGRLIDAISKFLTSRKGMKPPSGERHGT